jgi:hypothetical protein
VLKRVDPFLADDYPLQRSAIEWQTGDICSFRVLPTVAPKLSSAVLDLNGSEGGGGRDRQACQARIWAGCRDRGSYRLPRRPSAALGSAQRGDHGERKAAIAAG